MDINSTDTRIIAGVKKSKPVEAGGKITQIFTAIQENINSDLVTKTQAIYQFNVKGN